MGKTRVGLTAVFLVQLENGTIFMETYDWYDDELGESSALLSGWYRHLVLQDLMSKLFQEESSVK